MWNGFSAGSCRDSLPGRRRTLDGLKLRLTADRARPGPGGRGMWYLNCERKRRRELRGPPRRSEAPGGDDSRSWALFWKGPGNWGADFGAQRGGQFTKAAQVPTLKRRCTGSLAVPAHCMCSQQQVVAPFSVFLSWSFDPSEGGRGPGGLIPRLSEWLRLLAYRCRSQKPSRMTKNAWAPCFWAAARVLQTGRLLPRRRKGEGGGADFVVAKSPRGI